MQCRWIWDESLPWHVWSITWYARCLYARLPTWGDQETTVYSRFSCDVTAAMLAYRTIAKKVFWEFDFIVTQNLSDILPLFCTSTWPSHDVSENQELDRVCQATIGSLVFLRWSFLLVIPRAICGSWKLLTRHNGLEFLKTTLITRKRVKTLTLSPSVIGECNHNGWNK